MDNNKYEKLIDILLDALQKKDGEIVAYKYEIDRLTARIEAAEKAVKFDGKPKIEKRG